MKNILVTGSSGQLGRELVVQLRAKQYYVVGIDLVASPTTDQIIDIRNSDDVDRLTIGFDAIIHTAAMHGKHYELNYPREKFINTNINGTLNLLNACVLNGIRKFLYISTTSIYGNAMVDEKQAVWVDESLVPNPRDIYDTTKLTAELFCRDFFEKNAIESTVLRVSRFLPETENLKAIHRLYRGLDEADGARGIILALEKSFTTFEIYNISNDSPFKPEDLPELIKNPKEVIKKYYPNIEKIFADKNWVFPEKIDRVYSIEKAKRELNYLPINNFNIFIEH
ncbi:MAG: NAD(P)-dependent oxidoreductase [Arcicella sp.]|jgi:nucleoside-diphosphate-sugar epimerase|nr:NAD(P)-dependent oxidoreductase [Arcicella sp.]